MQRIPCPERDDWRAHRRTRRLRFTPSTASAIGTNAPTTRSRWTRSNGGSRRRTAEIDAMCLELVGRAVRRRTISAPPEDTRSLLAADVRELAPRRSQPLWPARLSATTAGGPAKLLEYNADTPTSIFEAAVFQWTWLEQAIERNIIPKRADQFNSIHERLIDAWKKLGGAQASASRGMTDE